jgi:phenylacetate-CoA ligase
MRKINKLIIALSMKMLGRRDMYLYDLFKKEEDLPLEVLQERQIEQFKRLFLHAKQSFPYYDKLFSKLKLHHSDFKTLVDLDKIPVLTKQEILNNYVDFYPRNSIGKFVWSSTGGSTGVPLKYRLSQECNSRGWALEWRGFSKAGFNVGDKLIVFGGGSLIKNNQSFKSKIKSKILNELKFSSYGLTERDLYEMYIDIGKSKAMFIYGYASSIALLSSFMIQHDFHFEHEFNGVFTTSEMLTFNYRNVIEKAFKCKVFNVYGINDGGIAAYENIHGDMQIDTERGILEVVDLNGKEVFDKSGRILATSLYNYAFPFIRYDTGDIGLIQAKSSKNYFTRYNLDNLEGRITDYIVINDVTIGSPVLTVLMSKIDADFYQFIQKDNKSLELRMRVNSMYTSEQETFIKNSLYSNLGSDFNLIIKYTSDFKDSHNKHKFIIKEF